MDKDQEAEVRQALHTLQDEFTPVKENIMTLLEHLEKRGEKRGQRAAKVATVVRLLSGAFPEFTSAVADQVGRLPDPMLDKLTDAIATRRTWAEIEPLIRRIDG